MGGNATTREVLLPIQRRCGKRDGGLTLGDNGTCLGDLLRAGAVLEPGNDGGLGSNPCTRQAHLVGEVGSLERGNDLAGVDPIALVDLHIGNATTDLEPQIDLADVDVALQDDNAAVIGSKAKQSAPRC